MVRGSPARTSTSDYGSSRPRSSPPSSDRRKDELDRGISLVGPHRDELLLTLGNADLRLPVKGYASHGESWSYALAHAPGLVRPAARRRR